MDDDQQKEYRDRVAYLEEANMHLKDTIEHMVFEREVLKNQLMGLVNDRDRFYYEDIKLEALQKMIQFYEQKIRNITSGMYAREYKDAGFDLSEKPLDQ